MTKTRPNKIKKVMVLVLAFALILGTVPFQATANDMEVTFIFDGGLTLGNNEITFAAGNFPAQHQANVGDRSVVFYMNVTVTPQGGASSVIAASEPQSPAVAPEYVPAIPDGSRDADGDVTEDSANDEVAGGEVDDEMPTDSNGDTEEYTEDDPADEPQADTTTGSNGIFHSIGTALGFIPMTVFAAESDYTGGDIILTWYQDGNRREDMGSVTIEPWQFGQPIRAELRLDTVWVTDGGTWTLRAYYDGFGFVESPYGLNLTVNPIGITPTQITTPLHLTAGAANSASGPGWDWNGSTLALSGIDLAVTNGPAIQLPANSTITLETGTTNTITNAQTGGANNALGIQALGALSISGNGSLEIDAGGSGILAINASLTITDSTIEIISGFNGMVTGGFPVTFNNAQITIDSAVHGITGNNITITGGITDITAGQHGINATNNVTIGGGADVTIDAGGNGIQTSFGDVTISDNNTVVNAPDGINAGGNLIINGNPTVISAHTITTAAITGVLTPTTGQTRIGTGATATGNFSVSIITWSPTGGTQFIGGRQYSASVTLTANAGHTFPAGFTATINGVAATVNVTNPGTEGNTVTVTRLFPETSLIQITNAAVNVTAPTTGAAPSGASTGPGNFTRGTVTWSPGNNPFTGGTQYTASITLTAAPGFTFPTGFTGSINTNNAMVSNTSPGTNGNSVTLTFEFPATVAILTLNPTTANITARTGAGSTATVNVGGTAAGPINFTNATTPSWINLSPDNSANTITVSPLGTIPTTAVNDSWTVTVNRGGHTQVLTVAVNIPAATSPITEQITAALQTNQTWNTTDESGNVTRDIVVTLPGRAGMTATVTASGGGASGNATLAANVAGTTITVPVTVSGTRATPLTVTLSLTDAAAAGAPNTGWNTVDIIVPATSAVPITTAAITVTAPSTGGTPNTTATIASGTGFTVGNVSWTASDSPAGSQFLGDRQYTATVTLTATTGNTFTGLTAGSNVTINNNNATITSNIGTAVTLSFQFASTAPAPINNATITNVQTPIIGATRTNTATATGNFTASAITWTPSVGSTFAASTVYTASITLTADAGHTFPTGFTGTINGNAATVNVVAPGTNANTVTLSWTFPQTGPAPVAPTITSGAPPSGTVGTAYNFTFTATGTAPITWSHTGTLPPGIGLTAGGVLSGTPTTAGSYTFTIQASNVAGNPMQTYTVVIGTAATAPSAPQNLIAVPGNGQVALSWTAPASDGGSAIIRYEVQVGTGAWVNVLLATSHVVTGLTNGTPVTINVRAVNAVGNSTNVSETVTPVTIPSAPLNFTATAGDGEVTLAWDAPASDGGSVILGYQVSINGAAWQTVTGLGGAFTGLDNGTTYSFRVRAVNSVGTSSYVTETATPTATHIPVSNITNVPDTKTAGISLNLIGTVLPSDATNQTKVWSIDDAGTTGATITGGTINTTAAGTLVVTATIANGASATTPHTQNFNIAVSAPLSGTNAITAFTIPNQVSSTITGNTISIVMPHNTNRANLTPTITHVGASISPASGMVQNLTNPVIYTVTAENGNTRAYTVTVTNAAPPSGGNQGGDNDSQGNQDNRTHAQSPRITQHPQNITVVVNENATLSVTANVTDGGTLSFQWYRATGASGGRFVAIQGATNSTFSPNTDNLGVNRYRVVVTNTNNAASISGNRTTRTTSQIATVTVTGAGLPNVRVELSQGLTAELRTLLGDRFSDLDINVSTSAPSTSNGFVVADISFSVDDAELNNALNNQLPSILQASDAYYTIVTELSGFVGDGVNYHRIVALQNGAIIGGSMSNRAAWASSSPQGERPARGMVFSVNVSTTGRFAISYVETLRRLTLSLSSFTITDLAGNTPPQTMDVLPIIQDGRTLVPIRFIAEALGANVDWTPGAHGRAVPEGNDQPATAGRPITIHITRDGQTLSFGIGEVTPQLAALGMDVPAQLMNDRTMVPLRFVAEFFGAVVDWDGDTRDIEIIGAGFNAALAREDEEDADAVPPQE